MVENNATRMALVEALLNPRRVDQPGLGAPPATISPMMKDVPSTLDQLGVREYEPYDPPPVPPLSFSSQYRRDVPVPADSAGRLTHDMEGRPLGARYVSGLTEVNGSNVGLRREQLIDVIRRLGPGEITRSPLPLGTYGRAHHKDFAPTKVEIRANLRPELARKVEAHELGHVIDVIAKFIPIDNHRDQLRAIYNSLNNPHRTADGLDAAPGSLFVPLQRSRGYRGFFGERELMAEAIRAYLVDPNYIKTVAPGLAAAIRDAVNSNPRLAPIIQFNNLKFPTHAGLEQPPGQTQMGSAWDGLG
jgi:hypothetical protein